MLSVHFNGEVVRHKDMRTIHKFTQERNDKENRCKYGVQFLNCPAWVNHCQGRPEIQKLSSYGTCILGGTKHCPNYVQRKKAGSQKKEFTIDWKTYRKIASATHYMLKEGEHKSVFFTLTFPPFRKNHKLTKSFYYDNITNILFSRFAENLRENYGVSHYIAVKEYGKQTNRVHFHIIACMPFIDYRKLNDSWNNTISNLCYYSPCALQTDKNTSSIIRNPARAIRYVCKYVSKSFGARSGTRLVFISNKTLTPPVKIRELEYNHVDYLKQFKSIRIQTYEHVTVFKITDRQEFNKFCVNFLYPLFECQVKKTEFHYLSAEGPP